MAWLRFTVAVVLAVVIQSEGQQSYVNNKQLDCDNPNPAFNFTKGYQCNGLRSSCQSYLTFRSSSPYYTSPVSISYLLGAPQSASSIASLNNLSSDVASIPPDTLLLVPLNCSCYNRLYYQHNASYTLKFPTETYFTVANNTYQGLSTCQALMAQNSYGERNLTVGLTLQVPLRCACPTSNQTASGLNYLLTYMVTWDDTISSIAQLFGADQQAILDANQLSSTDLIYPFTPLLVPLATQPNITRPPPASPPPQIPPTVPVDSSNNSSSKWVYVGVGIGAALLLVSALLGFLFWRRNKSKNKSQPIPTSMPKTPPSSGSADYSALPDSNTKSWSISSDGVRFAIESLTVYEFQDIQVATSFFSEDNRIKGSVYKGSFKGDPAAVKVMKGDVSGEINILKKINHSNIIRLSGFCLHDGNTYLVYEFAEKGALSDWLHFHGDLYNVETLTWKQRVQIAHDVADALNYLHNYTSPPYIHKNLKTSNILLDANLRAKVANFGLARMLESEAEGGMHLTRHVVGTQGYMAPEYIEIGVITPKLDVFAFGVLILELLSGKEASPSDKNAGESLPASISRVLEGDNVRQKLYGFMDPTLGNEYPLDLAFSLAQLAQSCVSPDVNARPSMSHVFISLSKILSSSLDWDPSLELQSSRSLGSGR